MPNNGATNRPYSGSNVLLLWHAKLEKGYKTSNWLTYRQAHELGGQVRKGEKSTEILFTKQHTVKDNQTEVEKRISFLRTYNVFNEDQIDGLPDRGVEILPSVDPRRRCVHQGDPGQHLYRRQSRLLRV
jgi:antirestriction protein ArdC